MAVELKIILRCSKEYLPNGHIRVRFYAEGRVCAAFDIDPRMGTCDEIPLDEPHIQTKGDHDVSESK